LLFIIAAIYIFGLFLIRNLKGYKMEYIKSWVLSLVTALGFFQPVAEPLVVQESYTVGTTRVTLVQGDITMMLLLMQQMKT
jgi:hypothetical protein